MMSPLFSLSSEQRFVCYGIYPVCESHIHIVVIQDFRQDFRAQDLLDDIVIVEVVELVNGDDHLIGSQFLDVREFLPCITEHLGDVFLRYLDESLFVDEILVPGSRVEDVVQFLVSIHSILQEHGVFCD